MRTFHRSVGTERRLEYADEVVAALRCDPATPHLAPDLEQANAALEAVWWERLEAQRELARARARLRVQDHALVAVIRALHCAVQSTTGIRGSVLEQELFPKGITAAIALAGAAFERTALDLQEGLRRSQERGADEVRASHQARFEAELARFRATLAARTAAEEALRRVRADEVQAREDHSRALGRVDGGLRVLFPRDPGRRRVFEPRRGRPSRPEAAPESPVAA